jgi:hypothetical protein
LQLSSLHSCFIFRRLRARFSARRSSWRCGDFSWFSWPHLRK